MSVIHDGIDVNQASRLGSVSSIRLSDQCTLSPGDSVVTFVNRRWSLIGAVIHLLRIPEIQRGCPNAKIVVVGLLWSELWSCMSFWGMEGCLP